MLKAGGNINIGTYNDNKGSNITVALPGSIVQNTTVPEDQAQPDTAPAPAEPKPRKAPKASKSKILLRQFKGNDVNFVRVIYALHEEGFFESEEGGKPTLKDVFSAFGIAINEDIDDFSATLSNNRVNNTPETRAMVFDRLKETYLEYEKKIDKSKPKKE